MKKIEYAVSAVDRFITHMHMDGLDRGMITTFGSGARVVQPFTSNEATLHRAMNSLTYPADQEQTRLYDSIKDVIDLFWRTGDKGRPWLLVVITDGEDNASREYKNNPWGIGQYIGQRFNHEPSNFIFVIGVGKGQEINASGLVTMGNAGQFAPLMIDAFPLLELIFLRLAVHVSELAVGRVVTQGNHTWGDVTRLRQINRIAFDYAFLLDFSGSMKQQG